MEDGSSNWIPCGHIRTRQARQTSGQAGYTPTAVTTLLLLPLLLLRPAAAASSSARLNATR